MILRKLNLALIGWLIGISGASIVGGANLQFLMTNTLGCFFLLVLKKGRLWLIYWTLWGFLFGFWQLGLVHYGGESVVIFLGQIVEPWRQILLQAINSLFWSPDDGLVAGVLLGERSSLDKELLNFKLTGLTHILAVSGFNVTLIINVLMMLMSGWPRARRFYLAWAAVFWFAILTGGSASVVRAAVMGSLFLLAKMLQRQANPITVLLWTAVLMSIWNESYFNHDLSFVLSFLATFSLLIIMPEWEQIELDGWKGSLWDGVKVTLAAQTLTLPVSLYYFQGFSIIAPLANLLVLPFVPILMLLGFFGLVGQILVMLLALGSWQIAPLDWLLLLLAASCRELVALMLAIVKLMANLPLAYWEVEYLPVWFYLLYWLLVFIVFGKSKAVRNCLQ